MDRDKERENRHRKREQERARSIYYDDSDKAKKIYDRNRGPLDADPEEWSRNMDRDR